MDLNRANMTALYVAYKARFQRGLRSGDARDEWMRIATELPSTTSIERYDWMKPLAGMREWIGERQITRMQTSNYSLQNKKYEHTVGVPREAIEDDQYGVYGIRFEEQGVVVGEHKLNLVYDALLAGETELCYTGQPFFDTAHPSGNGNGGSFANLDLSGSGAPWYLMVTTRPLKPLILQNRTQPELTRLDRPDDPNVFGKDELQYGVRWRGRAGYGLPHLAYKTDLALTSDNYRAIKAAMMSLENDEGQKLRLRPDLIVVPPSLEGPAKDLFIAERNSDGSTNTDRGEVQILVTPHVIV